MRVIVAGLMAVSVLLGEADAQQEHLKHFKAFSEARAAGDQDAVLREGEAAWRAAEAELGAHETTALLVQNLLLEAIWVDPGGSAEAAARALALGEAGLGLDNMPLAELRVASAYVAASAEPGDEALLTALVRAIDAEAAEGRALTLFTLRVQRGATGLALRGRAYDVAYDVATALARRVEAGEGLDPNVLAAVNLDRATALLSGRNRFRSRRYAGVRLKTTYRDQLRDAHVLIDHTIASLPSVDSLDAVDPIAAQARAYHGVIISLQRTARTDVPDDWTFEGKTPLDVSPSLVETLDANGAPLECEIEWSRKRLRYPSNASRAGYNGAVLVGFHLTPEGEVTDLRTLAEVPSERFAPTLLRQIGKWRADVEGMEPACLRNRTMQVNFTMRY